MPILPAADGYRRTAFKASLIELKDKLDALGVSSEVEALLNECVEHAIVSGVSMGMAASANHFARAGAHHFSRSQVIGELTALAELTQSVDGMSLADDE